MSTTERDASALAHLAVRLRADTTGCGPWEIHGTTEVFTRVLVGKNLQIAIELVVAHATDPDAKTPGAISRAFKPERRPPTESLNPTADTACTRCGRFKGGCHCTREKFAEDHADQLAKIPGADAALARALLRHEPDCPSLQPAPITTSGDTTTVTITACTGCKERK